VLDSRVLEALTAIRREDFVPPACRNLAFADLCLPLGHDEVMLKPVVEGRLLQAVSPARTDSVLEIGTGSGFFTACLARLAGEVLSVEQHADLADTARTRLHAANVRNAKVQVAEAVRELDPGRQFDVMIVTGAVHALPQHWRAWIKPGGRLLAIVGTSPAQRATLFTRTDDDVWDEQTLFETDIAYLNHAAPPRRFSL
jgi:protein-L-isoaspartate(D-aspartate) O-methyltransferase